MSQKPTANSEGETKEIDVGHLAELARLAINGAANVKIADDLQAIIAMIDTMQAVNTGYRTAVASARYHRPAAQRRGHRKT